MMRKVMIIATLLVGMTGQVAFGGEYEKAVLGHVVTNSSEIDKQKLLEAEMAKIGHEFALQMVSVMQKHLPAIIDGAMSKLRQDLDSQYKCSLLENTKIADKECQ